MGHDELILEKVSNTLIRAASTFREDQKLIYKEVIEGEINPREKWILESLLKNSEVAEKDHSPLCDDTGIPHLFLEIGKNKEVSGKFLELIQQGVSIGLQKLPGRPMAIKGNDIERLEQSGPLDMDPGALLPAPIIIKNIEEDVIRLYILMQGGGPEIRGKTYRIFHRHKLSELIDEIVRWATDEVGKLGCTPCVPAIGIGRTHFEATSLMIEAMVKGTFNKQNDIEREITNRINMSDVGPLGLGGNNTALATFVNVGPQRASGVRIVSLRLCCCVEPRVASVLL